MDLDLAAEATRLRLDVLAASLSRALDAAGVPHALLKGPTTSLWLYDPPRRYSDVDLLVPHSRVGEAAHALADAGLADSSSRVGEEAPHSLLMRSAEGFEVDLHVSLPTVPVRGDLLWDALAPHVEPFAMDVGTVPALDTVGRCLVLALHALENAYRDQPTEDLRRARAATDDETWKQVFHLAEALDIADLLQGGLARVEPADAPLSTRARLHAPGVPSAAIALQRIADAPPFRRPGILLREVFPSRSFMRTATGDDDLRGWSLTKARGRRWRGIARQLPSAVRSLRDR